MYKTFCDFCERDVTKEGYHVIKMDEHRYTNSKLLCNECFMLVTRAFEKIKVERMPNGELSEEVSS